MIENQIEVDESKKKLLAEHKNTTESHPNVLDTTKLTQKEVLQEYDKQKHAKFLTQIVKDNFNVNGK